MVKPEEDDCPSIWAAILVSLVLALLVHLFLVYGSADKLWERLLVLFGHRRSEEANKENEDEIERALYGKNQTSVRGAIEEQTHKQATVQNYGKRVQEILEKTEDEEEKTRLKDAYDTLVEIAEKKVNCLNTMLEITSLEDACANLSIQFDTNAVGMVSKDKPDQGEGGDRIQGFVAPSSQDCVFAARDNWRWISRLVTCISTHLENASAYQQFFHEIDESETWMEQDLQKLNDKFQTERQLKGDYDNAKRILEELQELVVSLRQWETKVNFMWEQGVKIVPVHLRTKGVQEPTPIRSLVDYETKNINVRENEDLLLLVNSDSKQWTVRNSRGQEATLPSLICLIPGPYKEAVDNAIRMRLKLLTAWTTALKRVGKKLITFMLLVFKAEYNDDEIKVMRSIRLLDKRDLLRILDYIEDTLKVHWSDSRGFQLLQERVLALRMILNEGGEHPFGDEDAYKALVVQVQMLEKLMEKYIDLWKQWELFKCEVETSQHPELMLIVDKWQDLQFVDKDKFKNFWQMELSVEDHDAMDGSAASAYDNLEAMMNEGRLGQVAGVGVVETEVGLGSAPGAGGMHAGRGPGGGGGYGPGGRGGRDGPGDMDGDYDESMDGGVGGGRGGRGGPGGGRGGPGSKGGSGRGDDDGDYDDGMGGRGGRHGRGGDDEDGVYDGSGRRRGPGGGDDSGDSDGEGGSRRRGNKGGPGGSGSSDEEGGRRRGGPGGGDGIGDEDQDGSGRGARPGGPGSRGGDNDGRDDGEGGPGGRHGRGGPGGEGVDAVCVDGVRGSGRKGSRGGPGGEGGMDGVGVDGVRGSGRKGSRGGPGREGGVDGVGVDGMRGPGRKGSRGGPGSVDDGGVDGAPGSGRKGSRGGPGGPGGDGGVNGMGGGGDGRPRGSRGSMGNAGYGLEEQIIQAETVGYVGAGVSSLAQSAHVRPGGDGSEFGFASDTRTAVTEQLDRAYGGEQRIFIIRSVVDPRDDNEISLQDAIEYGIINPDTGNYVNPDTNEKTPIPIAMQQGNINVSFTTTKREKEQKTSIGIITVKTIREQASQYEFKSVKDTQTDRTISHDEAVNNGIIDETNGVFRDMKNKKEMLISDAIERGFVEAELKGEHVEPEVDSRAYAVRAVVDRRQKKVITFQEAVRRGIIDKETGGYKDTITGEMMYVGDAIMKGFLKARKIEEAETRSLDVDPENKMVVDKTEALKRKLLAPLGVISAFKRAAQAKADE